MYMNIYYTIQLNVMLTSKEPCCWCWWIALPNVNNYHQNNHVCVQADLFSIRISTAVGWQ